MNTIGVIVAFAALVAACSAEEQTLSISGLFLRQTTPISKSPTTVEIDGKHGYIFLQTIHQVFITFDKTVPAWKYTANRITEKTIGFPKTEHIHTDVVLPAGDSRQFVKLLVEGDKFWADFTKVDAAAAVPTLCLGFTSNTNLVGNEQTTPQCLEAGPDGITVVED